MKKTYRIIKYSFLLSIFLLCFLLLLLRTDASEMQKKVVRVGYPIQTGLTDKDENGNYTGYEYDYLMRIAQYTDWEYEFVEVEGDSDTVLKKMLQMLEDGEIDILGSVISNEYTRENFNLTGYSYGNIYTTIAVLEQNPTYDELDYRTLSKMLIAVPDSSVMKVQEMGDFLTQNGIAYTAVKYATSDKMRQALEEGKVDAVMWSESNPIDGTKIVARFGATPYYFAVAKGKIEILNELNVALNRIAESDPYFEAKLHNKYFNNPVSSILLTQAEKNYIYNHPVIKVIIPAGTAPIQYLNKDGDLCGIAKGIMNRITEQTGLKFEYIETPSIEEALRIAKENNVDMVCSTSYDFATSEYPEIELTRPFLETDTVLYCNTRIDTGDLSEKRCAILECESAPEGVKEENLIYCKTREECIGAVNEGKADYGYSNELSVTFYTIVNGYKNLLIVPGSVESKEYCIGLINQDHLLNSIINKAISSIDDSQMQTIILSATTEFEHKITLDSLISAYGWELFTITLVIIALLLIILIYINRSRGKSKMQNRRYEQLSELTNEYMYEYDVSKNRIRFTDSCQRLLRIPEKTMKYNEALPQVSLLLDDIQFPKDEEMEAREIEITTAASKKESFRVVNSVIRDKNQRPQYILGKLINISKEKAEKQALITRAQMDGLTGIFNAITTKEKISKAMESLYKNETLVMILMDVDHFKKVNDTLGHYTGDTTLIQVADTLKSVFEVSDIIGRMGGDEFCICMLNNPTEKGVRIKCEKVLKKLNNQLTVEEKTIEVSISMGVMKIHAGEDYTEVYKQVDKLMYQSKQNGGNMVTYDL